MCDVQMVEAVYQPTSAHALPHLLLSLDALQQVDIVLLHAQHPRRCARLLSLLSARLVFAERVKQIVLLLMFALLVS
jgi:hypothetical protein